MLRTETTNDPALIAAQPRDDVASTPRCRSTCSARPTPRGSARRIHSGFGGQTDFIVGALHAAGGQALMALRSWHPKADVLDDRAAGRRAGDVLPARPRWSPSRGSPRSFGHDERAQARHLIEHAAHPSVREELWEEAAALYLLD